MVKIKITIPSVGDDASNFITSSFLFRSSQKGLFPMWNRIKRNDVICFEQVRHSMNSFGELAYQVTRPNLSNLRGELDPILTNTSSTINNLFLTKVQDRNFLNTITFKYNDGESIIIYGRKGSGHHIDGVRVSKKDLTTTLAKIIIRGAFVRSVDIMDDYIDKVIHYPPNVLHAIENRSIYWFYEAGEKHEVLINTKVISETECALEISDGIWGAITLKDLNVFINTFRFGQSKSKTWYRAKPSVLWSLLMGNEPTEIQNKLCIAWLMQNRKQDMVEDRATKLLHDMDREYPNITLVQFRNPMNKALYVRGKVSDWVIVDERKGMKLGHQNVNTYMIGAKTDTGSRWHGHNITGPICIDNIHKNSSIGDQLTARALALMNDRNSMGNIYTIRDYVVNRQAIQNGWSESAYDANFRINPSSLNSWSKQKEQNYITKMAESAKTGGA
jgi:hypothetical protein